MISRRQFVHFFKVNLITAGSFLLAAPNTFSQSLFNQYNEYNKCSWDKAQFTGYDIETHVHDISIAYCVIDGKVWSIRIKDEEVEFSGYTNKPNRLEYGYNSITLEQYVIEGKYLYLYECFEDIDKRGSNTCQSKPTREVVGIRSNM